METWFLVALIAPFLWAIVAIIDTYFVQGVYEDEFDGTIISGVFQSLPWFLVLFGIIKFTFPSVAVGILSSLAGGFFLFSFYFYFKALFVSNDTALMQILWNISVLAVPFFAWLLIGEVLTPMHYMGIAIAFFGITLFNLDKKVKRVGLAKIVWPMTGAVVFLSLSMVIVKEAYMFPVADFWNIFLLFSLGATCTSLIIFFIGKRSPLQRIKKIITLSKQYYFVFFVAEGISLVATMTSQKAISLAPVVSSVTVIESLVPVFVMIISFFIVLFSRHAKWINIETYRNQVSGAGIKILALACIIMGIYIIV